MIPQESDPIHTAITQPKINKINIVPQKSSYQKTDTITIQPSIESTYPVVQIDYFINEEFIGSAKRTPFSFTINLSEQYQDESEITIKIKVYDTVFNTIEKQITIPLASA